MDTSPKSDLNESAAERATRRIRPLEEKLAILREASEQGASVAAVARKHGMNANLLFGWLRLHRRGLLESQRHASATPLLPVKVTTPTLTPTERATGPVRRGRPRRLPQQEPMQPGLELVLPDGVKVRLTGQAERAVLDQLLEWFTRR